MHFYEDRGICACSTEAKNFKNLTCAYCRSRDAGQFDGVMSAEVGEKKILSTLLEGDKYITVIPWTCGVCKKPVGLNAVEHGSVAGNEERWFENGLLEFPPPPHLNTHQHIQMSTRSTCMPINAN